ncbi:MAG: hypothetical protein HRT92_10055 [Piscirickettsiaceae bacterium]|nr:hypothetical protein [Piscirickettsiaceae bacterium]
MEHIVSIIQSIAWPVTVIFIIYQFRGEINKQISRIQKIKFKDGEVSLKDYLPDNDDKSLDIEEKEKEKVNNDAAAQRSEEWKNSTIDGLTTFWEQLFRISTIAPNGAIAGSWFDVECAIRSACNKAGISDIGKKSDQVKILVEIKSLDEELYSYVKGMEAIIEDIEAGTVFSEKDSDSYIHNAMNIGNALRFSMFEES